MDPNQPQNVGSTRPIQEFILANIKDLPQESIREILAFIFFVRTKTFHPEVLTAHGDELLHHDLSELDKHELAHLELEFADYQSLYPYE
ncbi:MAG: hypothetical protein ABIO24_02675 [Saprospiraceae bacterium]